MNGHVLKLFSIYKWKETVVTQSFSKGGSANFLVSTNMYRRNDWNGVIFKSSIIRWIGSIFPFFLLCMWAFYLLKYVSMKSKKKKIIIIEDWIRIFSPRSMYDIGNCFKTLFSIQMYECEGSKGLQSHMCTPNRQSDDPPPRVTRISSMFFLNENR